jgi:uncharacterized membrane protein
MVLMMFGYAAGWPVWEIALMWSSMIVFLALLIWAAYALITSTTRRPGSSHGTTDARSLLDQRLARGEIDAAEYQRLRGLIASGDHQAPAGTGSSGPSPKSPAPSAR